MNKDTVINKLIIVKESLQQNFDSSIISKAAENSRRRTAEETPALTVGSCYERFGSSHYCGRSL